MKRGLFSDFQLGTIQGAAYGDNEIEFAPNYQFPVCNGRPIG